MPKYLTQEEAFKKCEKGGRFIPRKDVDILKIKSMAEIAEGDLEASKKIKKDLPKKSRLWSSVYKLAYDALHELTEAFLYFDKKKFDKHQCLFAYLCKKHPDVELDWAFFEKVRTKRNGINYYGTQMVQEDWKEIEVQINLYIDTIRKAVKKKMSKFKEWED
jgi:uncharacterized protein (UPF0332 family)